jgi:flagellar hook protein FlgE
MEPMTTVLNTAVVGLSNSLRSIETIAGNVANVSTDGYRAQRYDAATGTTTYRHEARPPSDAPDAVAPPASDVDLAAEFVDLKRHEIGYRANAVLVRVADRMLGELLDVLG